MAEKKITRLANKSFHAAADSRARVTRLRIVFLALAGVFSIGLCLRAATDPLFDLEAIIADPVDYKVVETEREDGIVFERFEFTSRVVSNMPERLEGIYAYPEGGRSLPALFWSMGGMAKAGRDFPSLFARKGYACMAITLQHNVRRSFRIPFDASNPTTANLTLLARDQLRGITALTQRPQVDTNRLAVAGASYGGVFATLIAGVDPRIKAGFSFFGAGNHSLGSNLPQFQRMKSLEDVAVWNRTFDPAFRLKQRAIPFMWGVAFNDNWFYFPAVAQTFAEAAGTEKRMVIAPNWQHGFVPQIDETLINFLDAALLKIRPAYNAPAPVKLHASASGTFAEFTWTGETPVTQAEVVVSFGEPTPWLGWQHRASFTFPAAITGRVARARVPIPSRQLPLIVWGTVTDTNGIVTSSAPTTMSRAALADWPVDTHVALNAFVADTLDESVLDFYLRHNTPLHAVLDPAVKRSGNASLRILPPDAAADKATKAGLSLERFFSVPGLAHHLTVWVRAESPTPFTLSLTPVRPAGWRSEVVRLLLANDPVLAPLLDKWEQPCVPFTVEVVVGPEWTEVALNVPLPDTPIDGYQLDLHPTVVTGAPWWIDSIRMQPVWPE